MRKHFKLVLYYDTFIETTYHKYFIQLAENYKKNRNSICGFRVYGTNGKLLTKEHFYKIIDEVYEG